MLQHQDTPKKHFRYYPKLRFIVGPYPSGWEKHPVPKWLAWDGLSLFIITKSFEAFEAASTLQDPPGLVSTQCQNYRHAATLVTALERLQGFQGRGSPSRSLGPDCISFPLFPQQPGVAATAQECQEPQKSQECKWSIDIHRISRSELANCVRMPLEPWPKILMRWLVHSIP